MVFHSYCAPQKVLMQEIFKPLFKVTSAFRIMALGKGSKNPGWSVAWLGLEPSVVDGCERNCHLMSLTPLACCCTLFFTSAAGDDSAE